MILAWIHSYSYKTIMSTGGRLTYRFQFTISDFGIWIKIDTKYYTPLTPPVLEYKTSLNRREFNGRTSVLACHSEFGTVNAYHYPINGSNGFERWMMYQSPFSMSASLPNSIARFSAPAALFSAIYPSINLLALQ